MVMIHLRGGMCLKRLREGDVLQKNTGINRDKPGTNQL
jgi:hypothetical protein